MKKTGDLRSSRNGRCQPLILLSLLLAAMLASARPLVAHGGGTPQLLNEPAGPYLISVWTDPEPLRIDDSHFNVAVLDPDTRAPILEDVTVRVELQPQGASGPLLSEEATTARSTNKTIYVAVFNEVPAEGRWQVTVSADGAAGATGPVSFDVDILPPAPFNWLRAGLLAGGVLALGLVVFAGSRRRTREPEIRRRRAAR
jgi:hypothetical protein